MMAREKLVELGYKNLLVYMGSFDDWSVKKGEIEKND